MYKFQVQAACALSLLVFGSSLGCVVLAVGAAGTGGYYLGSDDRAVGTVFDDAGITAGVKSELLADGNIKGFQINVDTHEGVVTLHGRVPNSAARRKAGSLAHSVHGVTAVENQLKVQ